MALTESQLAAMTSAVAARITGTVLGREASRASTVEIEIAGAAIVFCYDIAPVAPEAILREAAIRLAGWIYANRPHVSEHTVKDPSGTEISLRFNNSAATANGWRASGASALLARYIVRRGGIISGATATPATAAAVPDPDVGTTVMRAGFTETLPFQDSNFRWIGTANGVELDSTWTQPASFAFWLPGALMDRVIAVVLLRSIFRGSGMLSVVLPRFGPAIDYRFGATDGQLRHTAVDFDGNFSVPNDFRAILSEPR